MAVLAENDKCWVEIELGARGLAKTLGLTYVPFPLGSTKKPWQESKPSSPTEKHLYMLLPHAIGLFPPAQNIGVVVVATMSPTVFFEFILESFGCEVTKYPSDDHTTMHLDLTEMKSQKIDPNRRLVLEVHYCRIPHEYSDRLSAPETIPLKISLPNPDLLARVHDARHMMMKVRGLDLSPNAALPDAPGSVEFRACVYQLVKWAVSCGILCPRLELLTTEMIVFCVDKGWATLGIRGAKDYMSRETIGKLIERCMYPKVLGINATTGQLSIRTPSGRKLGFSGVGHDNSPVTTDTIKQAIIRDMTWVRDIAVNTAEGNRRFQREHQVYLQIIVRCWSPKAMEKLRLDFYSVLLHLTIQVMEGPMKDAIKTRVWPFLAQTAEVPREEGWVTYIGISEMVVDRHIDFVQYCQRHTDAATLEQLHEDCLSHPKFNRTNANVEISLHSQAELFGNEVALNEGVDVDDGVDFFEAILGADVMATIKAKPEHFDESDAASAESGGLQGDDTTERASVPVEVAEGAKPGPSSSSEKMNARTDHPRIDSVVKVDERPISPEAGPSRRFRTAAQAMHRLKWDPQHAAIHYEVGYVDRFDGAMWKPLDEWQLHTEEEDFIPEHRILLLRQMNSPRTVVWSRVLRYDGTGD